jgi:hypothetical protein
MIRFLLVVMALLSVPAARAGFKSQAAKEAAEYVAERFGRQAVKEGAEVLARKIEVAAARHGNGVFAAVRKLGPSALPLLEEAGPNAAQAARVIVRYGEEGATCVLRRPAAMRQVVRLGDEAAGVFVKHAGGIAEPVVEQFGKGGVKALESLSPQSGRRLAMLMADGDLAKIGRSEELLGVVSKYGDGAMSFIWKNKGSLAVAGTLTAFLAAPDKFLNAAQGMTKTVADSAVRPLAEVPGTAVKGIAEGTNWTVVFVFAGLAGMAIWGVRMWMSRRDA